MKVGPELEKLEKQYQKLKDQYTNPIFSLPE